MRPGPTARAALVLAAFLAVFVAVDRLAREPGGRRLSGASSLASTTAAAPSTGRPAPTVTAPRSTGTPTTTRPATTVNTLRPTAGVTVQVLNGAFVAGLAHRVAGRLREAGYRVVAENTALGNFPVSRIYYSEGHQADAVALRARFPVFRQIELAPANLSRSVDLHVVVGEDYR